MTNRVVDRGEDRELGRPLDIGHRLDGIGPGQETFQLRVGTDDTMLPIHGETDEGGGDLREGQKTQIRQVIRDFCMYMESHVHTQAATVSRTMYAKYLKMR